MALSIKELLIRRWQCIGPNSDAHFPGSPFNVNSVITESDCFDHNDIFLDEIQNRMAYAKNGFTNASILNLYPNLFRPMPWWEDRTPEQVRYVKYIKYVSMTTQKLRYMAVFSWEMHEKYGLVANGCIAMKECVYFIATKDEFDNWVNGGRE